MALLAPSRGGRFAAATAVVCLTAAIVLGAQTPPAPIEATVKAVYLFNFTKYVTWPSAPADADQEFRVCTTADDAFFGLLRSAVQGEDIDGKRLVPVALEGLDDARTCQILYVGDSQTPDAKEWLAAVRNAQVLTVADGTLNDETVIAFVRDANRIRFDINRAAASRHRVNISSKLLRLARQVRDR